MTAAFNMEFDEEFDGVEPSDDQLSDKDLIDALNEIDDSDEIDVTSWESKFLATVLNQKTLSPKQREVAKKMIAKYLE